MEEKISIIIPVYNAEIYLNKCIKSITEQTYKNLEIILVNDGSTDSSGKICDEWKEKDNRIKVIHQQNKGVSTARNTGLENSTGEWITFSDNDDYMDSDLIENLYRSAIKRNADISVGGFWIQTFLGEIYYATDEEFVTDSEEMIERLYTGKEQTFVWWKLFKIYLFDDISFPDGKVGEDMAVLYKLLDKAEIISNIDKAGYHWLQRGSSLGHKKFNKDKLAVIEFIEDAEKLVENKYPRIYPKIEHFVISELSNYAVLCNMNKMKNEYNILRKKIRLRIPKNLHNSKVFLRIKIKGILIGYLGLAFLYKPMEWIKYR